MFKKIRISVRNYFAKKIYSLNKSIVLVNLNKGYKICSEAELKGVNIIGKVNIGPGCKIINGVNIRAKADLNIGNNTTINGPNTNIFNSINCISIGKYCSIAEGVLIQEYNHNFLRPSTYFFEKNIFKTAQDTDITSKGAVQIGNDVWVGAKAIILGGSVIGDGAIIGANSVVSGNIPPYAIAVGSPAKVVKFRFDSEIIKEMERIKWWDWDIQRIRKNADFFRTEINLEIIKKMI